MIVIVDYGMGNLGSILNMLKKAGARATISSDSRVVEQAEKLILPGVGAFDNGMKNLAERGLVGPLDRAAKAGRPILGICLGMHLMTKRSEEGELPGLGWLDAETVRFAFDEPNAHLKIPHMGWNTLEICKSHPLMEELDSNARFYFVHSYHVVCADPHDVLARTNYGFDFVSVAARGNILGGQFHPEKSHRFGMRLLKNFADRV